MTALYVYDDPDEGPVCICENCYDNGNSDYDMIEVDRHGPESGDLDRICFFCGECA
jgi:hypothetical protein